MFSDMVHRRNSLFASIGQIQQIIILLFIVKLKFNDKSPVLEIDFEGFTP